MFFSTSGYGKSANDKNSNYEQKIDELQTDLNTTRVKLIEKEREVERLDAQVKTSAKSSPTAKGKLSRSGSQEEDLQKKIQVELFSVVFSQSDFQRQFPKSKISLINQISLMYYLDQLRIGKKYPIMYFTFAFSI